MAFPVVQATAESSTNTAGTSHTVTLPAGITAGDLLLICMNIGSTAASFNALAGWTELLDEGVAGGLAIWYRLADGSETNPTFTSTASTRDATITYRISGAEDPAIQAPQIGTTATGTSATPDPPASATPGATKDFLFIAIAGMAGEEADDDTWGNTPPTNYTPSPPRQKSCGTAGTNLGGLILSAERQLNTGAAENPGTFGVDVSAAWRAQTIMVHPAASTAHSRSPADTASITDSVAQRVTKGLSEAPTITDAQAKRVTKGLSESPSITDAQAKAVGKTVADSMTITDSVTPVLNPPQNWTRTVNDTISITDAVAKRATKSLGDGLSISDVVNAALGGQTRFVADAVQITDNVVVTLIRGRRPEAQVSEVVLPRARITALSSPRASLTPVTPPKAGITSS